MITVRLLGGAKKSTALDKLEFEENFISVLTLIDLLQKRILNNSPKLDVKNILIAINGVDSSALNGFETILKDGDIVSIIPVIHGGNVRSTSFEIFKTKIELVEIKNDFDDPIKFLEDLRKKYVDLIIQGVRSTYILSLEHVKKVITISLTAKKSDSMLSNKLETDVLMRFAYTRQISEAIKKAGIKKRENFILIAMGKQFSLSKLFLELRRFSAPPTFPKNRSVFLKKELDITENQLRLVMSSTPLEDLLAEKSAVLLR